MTRQSDGSPLAVNTASFTHVAFNVAGAASVTSHTMSVTFDAPPDPTQATTLANYSVVGLTLSGTPVLAGNTVTIATGSQSATTYTVSVANVTRASDGTVLTNRAASFTGRSPFDVTGAASTSSGSIISAVSRRCRARSASRWRCAITATSSRPTTPISAMAAASSSPSSKTCAMAA